MKNFVQDGNTLTVAAPYAVAGGDVVPVGLIIGVAAGNAGAGDPMDLVLVGVFDLGKVAADALAIGDAVYFDSTTKTVTKVASGNKKIGVAVAAAGASSVTVTTRLNASF